ncbi:hypothetical protein VTO73DRAFT_2151 [Trametes versicolor]
MALRTRLAVSDVLHRGLVWSLLGRCVASFFTFGPSSNRSRSAEALARQEALGPVPTVVPKDEDEKHEVALAEAAIAALKNRSNRA